MRWLLYGLATVLILAIAGFAGLKVMQHTTGGGHYSFPSGSMMPTLHPGEHIVAWPAEGTPDRGDVILFKKPGAPGTFYVKRVIALPGDRIEMRDGGPVLNGETLSQTPEKPYAVHRDKHPRLETCKKEQGDGEHICRIDRWREELPGGRSYHVLNIGNFPPDVWPEATVPKGHVFVLGDNRDNSLDSRFPSIGFIPINSITGKVAFRLIGKDANGTSAERSLSRIE